MPDPVFLPRKLFIPGLQKVTVTPQTDGSIDVTGNFAAGVLNLSGGPLSFSLTALLKLLEDLATDLPVLIADVEAVFASTPSVPTPAPTSPTH
jgi:hypothetical protein